jgi:hypothetical protein
VIQPTGIQKNAVPVKSSIKMLMVPLDFVSKDVRVLLEAKMTAKFLPEFHYFLNCLNPFASDHSWIIAEDEDVIAHEWHEKYSLGETEVLEPLCYRAHLRLGTLVVENTTVNQPRGTRRTSLHQRFLRSSQPFLLLQL